MSNVHEQLLMARREDAKLDQEFVEALGKRLSSLKLTAQEANKGVTMPGSKSEKEAEKRKEKNKAILLRIIVF